MKNRLNRMFIADEMIHHDNKADVYTKNRETDYIWEIPEEILLFKKKYFKKDYVVIDMGCGPSVSIKNILPNDILNSCQYIGVDISKNLLNYAKHNITSGKFINADMSTVKFRRNYADIIVSLGALHHCQDKHKTLEHWLKILKKEGLLLLREPTYEALKMGQGESTFEEGIKVEKMLNYLKKKDVQIVSLVYFQTPVFHFINRVLIKFKLNRKQKLRKFWFPLIWFDIFLCKSFFNTSNLFKGEAFALTLKKI